MKIEWTDPSVLDLESIRDYIAKDSEYYAAEFITARDGGSRLAPLYGAGMRAHPIPLVIKYSAAYRGVFYWEDY